MCSLKACVPFKKTGITKHILDNWKEDVITIKLIFPVISSKN